MSLKTWSAVLLVVVALGVLVQSLGDPVVPLGSVVIFLVAAAVTGFVRGRWAAIAAVLASVFLLVVTVVVGSAEYLVVVREPLQTLGLWIQVIAAVAALACAIAVLFRRGLSRRGLFRRGLSRRGLFRRGLFRRGTAGAPRVVPVRIVEVEDN